MFFKKRASVAFKKEYTEEEHEKVKTDDLETEHEVTTPKIEVASLALMLRKRDGSVWLSPTEIRQHAQSGVLRNVENIKKYKKSTTNFNINSWTISIESALGEAAVYKYLAIYYNPASKDDKFAVKTTLNAQEPKLIIRKQDSDDLIYFLVMADCPAYYILGWLYGRDAKQEKYYSAPSGRTGAWFVPAEELKPLNELPEDI